MIDTALSLEIIVLAAGVFLLAGTVKGALGIGLPTVSVSMLAQFIEPRMAIAFLLLPALVSNTWQIYRGGRIMRSARKLWPFVLVMAVIMFISSLFAAHASTRALIAGIGVMVVLWTLMSLVRTPPKVPDHLDRPLQVLMGAISGVIGGLTSMWSPPMVIYLLSTRCNKEDFVRFTGFIILCGTVPLTAGYIANGLMNKTLALASVLMIVPTLAGFVVGEYLRRFMGDRQFEKVLLVIFFFMGLNLIRRAILL